MNRMSNTFREINPIKMYKQLVQFSVNLYFPKNQITVPVNSFHVTEKEN